MNRTEKRYGLRIEIHDVETSVYALRYVDEQNRGFSAHIVQFVIEREHFKIIRSLCRNVGKFEAVFFAFFKKVITHFRAAVEIRIAACRRAEIGKLVYSAVIRRISVVSAVFTARIEPVGAVYYKSLSD